MLGVCFVVETNLAGADNFFRFCWLTRGVGTIDARVIGVLAQPVAGLGTFGVPLGYARPLGAGLVTPRGWVRFPPSTLATWFQQF